MKNLLAFVLFFSCMLGSVKSQQTLTQINGWNAYVHLPANYNSTTQTYPTIIFFPGLGEVGTSASALISNGPGAYITQGWNGNVVVDGNTVEFIVISLQPPSAYPNEALMNQKIQTIKANYRVDPNRLYLTGLSHGGWCSTTFVTGDAYGGPYTYASQIAAVVEVEGVIPDDNSPYPNQFDNFALSGGKLLGFEQTNDFRGIPGRVARMNATKPNSGIFVSTSFGGGAHCCWEQFYGGKGTQPGVFSLGGINQNLYQWLARQSRGSSVITPPPVPANLAPTVYAGSFQSITLPTNSISLTGTASDADGSIASKVWTKLSGPSGGTITSPNALTTTVTGLVQGSYVFQLSATDNVGAISKSTVSLTVNASYAAAPGCNAAAPVTHTLVPNGAPGAYEIYITNASARGWKGGDTLKIPAGTYSVIEIDSFGGDPCRDIIIMNSGGLVNVTGPMRFQKDVRYVKIMGSGAAGVTYGFKCISFAFTRVNHFTMERIECGPNPGGVGIYGKQDPYVGQPWTQYPNYTMRKITINNCYVHDVAGEGMYIGHTGPSGDPYNSNLIPIRMDSVTISNNIVTNTGWDGIQLSNARNGCNIFGNTVTNFGIVDYDGQRSGIITGGNTNSNIYNNTITTGTGNAIEFFGYGPMQCYNNTITNVGSTKKMATGEESIYGSANANPIEANPKQAMVIHDNQFNNPTARGAIRFWEWANSELPNIYNNKFCFATPPPANWQTIHLAVQPGFNNVNNILSCGSAPSQAPTANAGSNQTITLPISSVTLTGSGTAAAGNSISSYSWTKVSGGAAVITSPSSASTTLTGLVAGTYVLRLTVNDNKGLSGSDDITVVVNNAGSLAPTASAGSDKTITLPTASVSLSGSGAAAAGSTISSYSWMKMSGGAAVITSPSSASTTVTGLVAGTYVFRITVADNKGLSASDDITVFVNGSGTQVPTASAGGDITITLPATSVSLTGSGAASAGSTISSYSWMKMSGGAAVITSSSSANTTVTGLVAGTYVFRLSVTDSKGLGASDDITVYVINNAVGYKSLKVNVYGGANPYNSVEWNNWNIIASLNTSALKYADGTASTVTANLNYSQGIGDNGAGYPGVMAPSEVLRYTSYSTGYRLLTISGLAKDKKYNLELFASRSSNSGSASVFVVNQQSTTVSSYNNSSNKALFNAVTPNAQGQIVVSIDRVTSDGYNYLNGFIISENSSSAAARILTTDVSLDTSATAKLTTSSVTAITGNKFNIFPNPVTDRFKLEISNSNIGNMSVRIVNQVGSVVKTLNFRKDQNLIQINVPVAELNNGIYFVKVQIGNWTETKKIIKL